VPKLSSKILWLIFLLYFNFPPLAKTEESALKRIALSSPIINLQCMFGVDSKIAWVGGSVKKDSIWHTVLFITNDQGKSWKRSSPVIYQSEIFSIFFLDKMQGWAVGAETQESIGYSFVLRTKDGGKTWETTNLPFPTGTLGHPLSIEFINPNIGIVQMETTILEDEHQFFVTHNGGETWKYSHSRHNSMGGIGNHLSIIQNRFHWKLEKKLNYTFLWVSTKHNNLELKKVSEQPLEKVLLELQPFENKKEI